jgi:hypothetical protein
MKTTMRKVVVTALTLAAAFALVGATLAADDAQPLEVSGDGSALQGTVRGDVTRVAVVRVDGTEVELAFDAGGFKYEANGTGAAATSVRAYAGDRLVSFVRVEPAAGRQPRDVAAVAWLASRAGMRLAPVDPATLRPLAGGFRVGRPSYVPLEASPDGRTFGAGIGGRAVVRLVRFKPFGRVADVRVGSDAGGYRSVTRLGWLAPDRLLAVVERLSRPTRRYIRERTLVVVDPRERRVVARRTLPKLAIQHASTAGGRFVLLFGRASRHDDSVTLVVADGASVRTKEIVVGRRGGARVQTAFAVAPSGAHGFLFTDGWGPGTGRAFSVDLGTLAVEQHALRVPSGSIPLFTSSTVHAVAADDTHVAVTGVVASTVKRNGAHPAGGVWLVDTASWSAAPLDARAVYVYAHEERLLTFGSESRGVSIFSARGGPPLHRVFAGVRFGMLEFAGPYGHLLGTRPERRRFAFDVTTGAAYGPFAGLKEEILGVVSGGATPGPRTLVLHSAGDPFATVSNRGTPIRLAPETRRGMLPSVRAYLLATEDGRAFFRLDGFRPRVTCWGYGRAGALGVVGSFGCGTPFPSRRMPILDSALFEQSQNGFRVHRVEGFAADAVRSVELVAEDGTVTRKVISRNVFSFSAPPKGTVRLVARAADGGVVAERSYAPRPVPPTGGRPNVKRIGGYSLRLLVPTAWHGRVYRQLPPHSLVGPVWQVANFRLPSPPTSASILEHDGLALARAMKADGILISLREVPNTCCTSPVVTRLPVQIGPSDLTKYQAPTEDRSLALKSVRIRGRALVLFVYFGRRDVPLRDLDAANRVLASLIVGLRPPLHINRKPLQHGAAPGIAVDVYRDNTIVFRLDSTTSALGRRLRATGSVSLQCVKARFNGHSWIVDGTGASPNYGREMYVTLPTSSRGPFRIAKPPYDGCSLATMRGWKWDDSRGTHREVEIGFTAAGRRYYEEQAAARYLALFVRQREVQRLRRGGVEPFSAFAQRYPGRVVALASATATPASGQIGYWFGGAGTFTFSTASAGGRRLFVEVRKGKIGRHNLGRLAFVF